MGGSIKISIFIKKRLHLISSQYIICNALRGCSSAGLERLPVTQKVEGSSPFNPARNLTAHSDGFFYCWKNHRPWGRCVVKTYLLLRWFPRRDQFPDIIVIDNAFEKTGGAPGTVAILSDDEINIVRQGAVVIE